MTNNATAPTFSDETNACLGAARARECAKLRDFIEATPASLASDYARHGNAWPFSGDHLGTYDEREEFYIRGVGWEQGDIVGRVRVRKAAANVWACVAA